MDISSKYIKMCEKAEEIQEEYFNKFKNSEYHYNFLDWVNLDKSFYRILDDLRTIVWLPRQDQLQEMMNWGWAAIINGLYEFCTLDEEYNNFSSIEQLTLAFVMQEKHKKVWDDKEEKWIKTS